MHYHDRIPGYTEFSNWCGGWPSFHDAEILTLELNRRGVSRLVVSVMGGLKPTFGPRANDSYACPPSEVVVTFVLEEIDDLELADFSSQNVMFDLRLEEKPEGFRIHMDPCFGMSGFLIAKEVKIEFSPVTPG